MPLNRPLDHQEYIKLKYLSEPTEEVKEKKLRKKVKVNAAKKLSNIRVFDDDLDLNKIKANDDDDDIEMKYGTNEEKPSVAMIIDERSAELKRRDLDKNTWRPVAAPCEAEPLSRPTQSSSSSKKSSNSSKVTKTTIDLSVIKKEPNTEEERDLSPPRVGRRKNADDDDDLSPPRVSSRRRDDDDLSPPRTSSRREDDGDISPPRRHREAHRDTPPPRSSKHSRWNRESKPRFEDDSSPPRVKRRNDSDDDSSPVRRRRRDMTPPPRNRSSRSATREKDGHSRSDSSHHRNKLGLTEEEMGRGAKTVYRDRGTGQKRDMEAEAKTKVKPDPEEEELKRKYEKWSKGVKQVESLEERKDEVLREMEKPLARYEDDEDRDKYLKEKELEDDPMLQYIRKKKQKEEMKKAASDGRVYVVKPKYQGPPPAPNRFGIAPGYRWDGVDRSNGFEKKLMCKNNEKMANLEEAYKWSTEDM